MIFELYTVGEEQEDGSIKRLGSTLIANKLNEMKIPPAQGTQSFILNYTITLNNN